MPNGLATAGRNGSRVMGGLRVIAIAAVPACAAVASGQYTRTAMSQTYGCAANALFVAAHLIDRPIHYSEAVRLLPPERSGRSVSEVRSAAAEAWLQAEMVWLGAASAGAMRDVAIVLLPGDPGRFVVVEPSDAGWTVYDFPERSPVRRDGGEWLKEAAERPSSWSPTDRLPAVVLGAGSLRTAVAESEPAGQPEGDAAGSWSAENEPPAEPSPPGAWPGSDRQPEEFVFLPDCSAQLFPFPSRSELGGVESPTRRSWRTRAGVATVLRRRAPRKHGSSL